MLLYSYITLFTVDVLPVINLIGIFYFMAVCWNVYMPVLETGAFGIESSSLSTATLALVVEMAIHVGLKHQCLYGL